MKSPGAAKQITIFIGLVVKNNKILMVQRNEPEVPDAHLKWEFPGGKVEIGEAPEEAIVRELKEETGVAVEVKGLMPCVVSTDWNYPWGRQHTIILGFECKFLTEEKREKDHKVEDVEWILLDEVLARETMPSVKVFLKALSS